MYTILKFIHDGCGMPVLQDHTVEWEQFLKNKKGGCCFFFVGRTSLVSKIVPVNISTNLKKPDFSPWEISEAKRDVFCTSAPYQVKKSSCCGVRV
jgi:hypothetical protein